MLSKPIIRTSLILIACLVSLNGCASLGRGGNGQIQTGRASWYGRDFHGKLTSSGEPYDMYDLTAAHRTLPLGTKAKVTNLDNDRKCIVRVNDRGPFVGNRIIDLSYAAAQKLDMIDAGIANVRVEVISTPSNNLNSGNYCLQFGAFSERGNAERLRRELAAKGYEPTIESVQAQGRTVYRVRMGSYHTLVAAESARIPLTVRGITCVVVNL